MSGQQLLNEITPTQIFLACWLIFRYHIEVKFVGQGHKSKFKVTENKQPAARTAKLGFLPMLNQL